MAYIEKGAQTEIGRKIEELARKIPAPLSWLVPDPLHDPTGGFGLTPAPVAISLPYATKQILKIPRKGLSEIQRQAVKDTLKVLQATPKRALQTISNLTVEKPETFKDAATLLGSWGVRNREITLSPLVKSEKLPRVFKALIQQVEKKGESYNLPESLAHETGHEVAERLMQKRGKSTFDIVPTTPGSTPTGQVETLYSQDKGLWEGIAEYLGSNLAKKAKVPYTPKFSYGPEQELIFNVLEKAPSKNPYMNVFRFLEKEGTLTRRPQSVQTIFKPEGWLQGL